MANVSVYLPREIERKAREANLNLSRTLRDAVVAILDEKEIQQQVLAAAESHWNLVRKG